MAVTGRRYLAEHRDRGVDVLAVSGSGALRTVHRADSIDISRFAPVMHCPPPNRIRGHIDEVRSRFDHLENFWCRPDGTTHPLSAGLSEGSVSVEGDWPGARVVVTFRNRRRPGLLLRRALRLFDDTGSPIDHEFADIQLM